MKNFSKCSILFIAFSLLLLNSRAQSIEVQLNTSQYSGGYNVSCYGSTNGSISTVVTGGIAPYTYVWSNGATTKNLTNIAFVRF